MPLQLQSSHSLLLLLSTPRSKPRLLAFPFSFPSVTFLPNHSSRTCSNPHRDSMATAQKHHRRKMPSFSSSLLDAIYHSIDDSRKDHLVRGRNDPEKEIESLRRAIRVEKWMENHSATPMHHAQSNSAGSSTDSSMFSSSETESSAPKTKREGRFTRTKSRALKIYGDLKRVREPISPGGKIVTFLNSLFGPRSNMIKKSSRDEDEWGCSVRKSRSMKSVNADTDTTRSCLNRNPNKSKRTVRFCPVNEDIKPRVNNNDEYSVSASVPNIGSRFLKKNMESLRGREFCEEGSDGVDDMSCASSDLFELENIGRVGIGVGVEELPVYGTTSLKMNQAIANGLIM